MIVKISEIDNELIVKGKMEGSQLTMSDENEFCFLSPVDYSFAVRKFENLIRINGSMHCTINLTCSKCLDAFAFPIDTYLDIEFSPKVLTPEVSELELKRNKLDMYYYEGDEIDLDPLIYDELMLNMPVRPLCEESCKGLCDVCGKNKNYEECRCDKVSNTLLGEQLKSLLTK